MYKKDSIICAEKKTKKDPPIMVMEKVKIEYIYIERDHSTHRKNGLM